jgi:hypothetical protein
MIIVKLIGGLGNQFFQYALGRNLAIKNNTELKLDISEFEDYKLHKYGLHHFNIVENIVTKKDLMRIKMPSSRLRNFFVDVNFKLTGKQPLFYKEESYFHFDPGKLNLPDNVYLVGYWQSEKYFEDIKSIIRKEFTIKTQPDPINTKAGEQISSCESVSVHVRRGDYIMNPATNQIHGVCSTDYYYRAIDRLIKNVDNPHFFVFSDDPAWARNNLKFDYATMFLAHNGPDKSYEDLRLMSMCKHHITANSSFSWWGAWLSGNKDKIVIAPKKWFNQSNHEARDIIPDSWYRL